MTTPISSIDNTTLLNLTGNLDMGDIADPGLRLVYFQYLNVYIQSITAAFNAFVASGAIQTGNLADLSVTSSKLADLAVNTGKIAELAVTTAKINDLAVTIGKMATNSVGSTQMVDLSVVTSKLNNLCVTIEKIADGAVTLAKMASGSVGTTQLVDLSVTNDKVANGTLTAAKFVAGALTNDTENALRITELQADNAKYTNQEDFVQTLKRHMKYKGTLTISPADIVNGILSIVYDIGSGKAISYNTYKDANDDYLVVSGGKYGTLATALANKGDFNYDSDTGTWNKASMPSYYATVVGATFTYSFFGSGLDFNFFGDNRGGLWKFVIDGDNANPVNISTWRSVGTSPATAQVFRQSDNKQHTVVATFMGDDPANVPSGGAGTSRGWANYSTNAPTYKPTFTAYAQSITNAPIVELLATGSNKDFAVSMRKSGTTNPYYFIPQHQAGTAFKIANTEYMVDGVPTTITNGASLTGIREFKIIQQVYGKCPETTENLAKFTTVWSFYGDGTVNVDGKMEVLQNIDIDWGYGIMFTLSKEFTKKLVSSLGNKYNTLLSDGSSQYLPEENDKATSYISLNDSTYKNLAVAVTYNNPKQTLRQGATNKPVIGQNTFIQHRDTTITKLYQAAFYNTSLVVGDTFRFSGTFFIASIDGLYDLF